MKIFSTTVFIFGVCLICSCYVLAQDKSCSLSIAVSGDEEILNNGAVFIKPSKLNNVIAVNSVSYEATPASFLADETAKFSNLNEGIYTLSFVVEWKKYKLSNYKLECSGDSGEEYLPLKISQEKFIITRIPVKTKLGENSLRSVPSIVDGGVLNKKAKELPSPIYPRAAKAAKAFGVVNVSVVLDEDGNVIFAEAIKGHPLLRKAASEAASRATFTAFQIEGQPVKVTGVIIYNFVAK